MRPANLFARSLLFYERTDMSSGAQGARATNGRGCESTKHGATGLSGGGVALRKIVEALVKDKHA